MKSFVVFACIVAVCVADSAAPTRDAAARRRFEEEEAERNAHAHYAFQADVDDRVSDLTQHRQEVRDGLAVQGSFAYSDGFVRRLVKYEADENGYRVISDEAQPLDGPKEDPSGVSSVHTVIAGKELQYSVQNDPSVQKVDRISVPVGRFRKN